MKVLHLTTHLNTGGITTYILRLAVRLANHGIYLHVLSSGGEYEETFTSCGVPIWRLPIRTKSELHPKLYASLPAALKMIRENKIDILHAHTRVTQVLAWWLKRLTGIPLVTTCHGFYKRRLGRRLLPCWGDRVIAISEPVRRHLEKDFKVPSEKIRCVNNAVDLEKMDVELSRLDRDAMRKHFAIDERAWVVGVVSRLVPDKGHEFLLRAVGQLRLEFPDLYLLVVGEGLEKTRLESLARHLKIQDRIVFTGNLANVCQALAAMDLFVLPAVWREGFGLSIIEAMACRKPVIVTNIWALNELIQDRVNGILVEPAKVGQLADAIRLLLRDQNLRERLALSGRKLVEDLFSMDRMTLQIKGIYEELLV